MCRQLHTTCPCIKLLIIISTLSVTMWILFGCNILEINEEKKKIIFIKHWSGSVYGGIIFFYYISFFRLCIDFLGYSLNPLLIGLFFSALNATKCPCYVFLFRFEDDKDISTLFEELWEEIPSGERVTLQLYLEEVVSLLCDCMASSSWAAKRKVHSWISYCFKYKYFMFACQNCSIKISLDPIYHICLSRTFIIANKFVLLNFQLTAPVTLLFCHLFKDE